MISSLAILACLTRDTGIVQADLHGKFSVLAYEGENAAKLEFPLPRDYRGQVPIGFQLQVKPANVVASKRIVVGKTGDTIVQLKFIPLKPKQQFEIEWKGQVMVDVNEHFGRTDTPISFPATFPEETQDWMKASAFIQSDDPRIKKAASNYKRDDVFKTIDAVLAGMVSITSKARGQITECSSVTALTKQGSCTSNANLCAALLRANGIPARILAGYPTWAHVPYQTHYIVEAYVPSVGWYPIESTMFAKGWVCANMPIVSIVSRANEDLGVARIPNAAGVAYLTLNEVTGKIVTIGTLSKDNCDHEAKLDVKKTFAKETLVSAQSRWKAWLDGSKDNLVDLPPLPPK